MTRTWTRLVATMVVFSLAGCGMGHSPGFQASSDPQGYSLDDQPQLIIKRKPDSVAKTLTLASRLRHLRYSAIAGVELAAVAEGSLASAVAALRADPTVEYVEPNGKVTIPDPSGGLEAAQSPNFPGEYGPTLTQAKQCFLTTIGWGQVIAFVDTGIDLGHPDFTNKLVPGTNTLDPNGTTSDDHGHGTHSAGIAAGLQDDPGGIVGMAPGARIMPIKALGADGSGSDLSVSEGVRWATDHGATIISLSLAGAQSSRTGREAIAYALQHGVTVVAAMGDDGSDRRSFPAAYPGVIAVGATDIHDQVTAFSQWGDHVSVTAPGYSILSTMPTYRVAADDAYDQHMLRFERLGMRMGLKYGYMTGTSLAASHVAGLAALVRAMHPSFGPAEVKARIEASADHVSGMAGPYDLHYGHGRIDARRAI